MLRIHQVIVEFTMLHAFIFLREAVGSGLDILPSMNPSLFLAIKAVVTAYSIVHNSFHQI